MVNNKQADASHLPTLSSNTQPISHTLFLYTTREATTLGEGALGIFVKIMFKVAGFFQM